jgi:hypothetical protein
MDTYTTIKVLVVSYIVFAALFDVNHKTRVPCKKVIDILLLGASVIVMLFDFHLGLLVTIAVLIYILQTNQAIIEEAKNKWQDKWDDKLQNKLTERFQTKELPIYPQVTSACAPSDEYGNEKKQEASKDILNYTLDDKVKPYDVYVKMLTTQEHLDNASSSAFLEEFTQ